MARSERSLRVSQTGREQAKAAFERKGWTQDYLAGCVRCTRQVVGQFFGGKAVEKRLFLAICTELGLEWGDIAELEPVGQPQPSSIDDLVQTVRETIRDKIQKQCGTMRVLDMTAPIGLNHIYTHVNILEKITGRRRKEIPELLQECDFDNFERFGLSGITEKRVPGPDAVKKYPKLMILGKPGAGKTTFLKHLAIECIGGMFQAERIPLFITLKDFAEMPKQPDLLDYLIQLFSSYGFASNDTSVEQLLKQGNLLILLDGLDEVRESDSSRVLQQIHHFAKQFDGNQFVITCRIAAREYTFEQFTEVEIADFDAQQIAYFANRWFSGKDDRVKAERFIQKLKKDKPIRELATNPLLLTLLCLVFEESGSFPSNRSELYKEGLDVLLKKWDAKRNIERDQVYKKLSLKRKEDLLSQIALDTFERGDYFFKQKEVERYITDYIRNLPDANTDTEALQLDSEAVLKSIEAQHGLLVERARCIYSFSHLSFHEYFTARKIVESPNPQALEQALQSLVGHITEKRWREVFLLTVGMLPSADYLLQLMKHQIDSLLAGDEKLQQFLVWVEEKSRSVEAADKPAAVRAFYFTLDRTLDRALVRALVRALDLALDRALIRALDLALDPVLDRALDRALHLALDPELQRQLKQLKHQLPDTRDWENCQRWWQANGQVWTEELRSVMIQHRNIGHDWQFSDSQKKLQKQYQGANKLLVDCLNSDCYVSREVRQSIEDTLLLPWRG
jgi:predicted NACHT family NTPase